jgi:hypothetical protein
MSKYLKKLKVAQDGNALPDHIRQEVDGGKCCGMAMLELQKAFDTVDHEILLIKLRAMGFNNLAAKWVSSYLQ